MLHSLKSCYDLGVYLSDSLVERIRADLSASSALQKTKKTIVTREGVNAWCLVLMPGGPLEFQGSRVKL